jgi:hypothetical protein
MRESSEELLTEALFAGLIGYATAIVVVGGVDLLAGRSLFFTPALLGATLFYGLQDPTALVTAPGPVLAYNMVHVLGFLLLGLGGAWSVRLAERYPSAQYLVLVIILFVAFHVYAALLFFAQPLLGSAGWWKLGLGSIAAALAMGTFLLRRHALLRRELRDIPMGESR